jgi:glycosyltransferase involved in cell wall biosynthesis
MKNLKVLHIISKLPIGGVENQLLLVLKNYDREKFQPFVCSLSEKGEIGQEIEKIGIKVFALNKLKHTFDYSIIKDICDIIKRERIQIVRTHQYHANFYGRIAAKKSKVPCIVASVHNVYTRDKKLHRRIINRFLARFTDKIIAVSEEVKMDILKYDRISEDKVQVIYNGVDLNAFNESFDKEQIKSKLGINPNVPVIGTVGRLTEQKGHIYLLQAILKLKHKFPDIKVLIVGDGPLMDELKSYTSSSGLSNNVIFTGFRRDIPALLSIMDIFVFPSLWEGLPNALIEAMASGKAIIASNLPQIKEVLDSDGLGILVPPKDSDSISQSINFLLKNEKIVKKMGNSAKNMACTRFNIENTVKIYEKMFEKILIENNINF